MFRGPAFRTAPSSPPCFQAGSQQALGTKLADAESQEAVDSEPFKIHVGLPSQCDRNHSAGVVATACNYIFNYN